LHLKKAPSPPGVAKLDGPIRNIKGYASNLRKSFSIEKDLIGSIIEFNGDKFAIVFN